VREFFRRNQVFIDGTFMDLQDSYTRRCRAGRTRGA